MPFPSGTKGAIRASYVELPPRVPTGVPNNALYVDSAGGNALTTKTNGGTETPVGAVSSADILIKSMRNTGVPIAAGRPVAKKADGSLVDADSDGAGAQAIIGITLDAISQNANGRVQLVGANVAGVLTGLGFTAGQDIYLGENGGYTNDPNSFAGANDSIIKIGVADCAADAAVAAAVDLILFTEVLIRP